MASQIYTDLHNIRKKLHKVESAIYGITNDLDALFNTAYDKAWENDDESKQDEGSDFAGKLELAAEALHALHSEVIDYEKEYKRIAGTLPKSMT